MRTAVILLTGLLGCSLPHVIGTPDSAEPLPTTAQAPPVPTVPPLPAPLPREIEPLDPQLKVRAARFREHRNSPDPILRGLARGDIKAGDPLGTLIKDNPHYDVLRFDDYVMMGYDPTGYGGTRLMAKNGKLVLGITCSCVYHDVFFNKTREMTEQEHVACAMAERRARQQQLDFGYAMPAAVGVAGSLAGRLRPELPK
jgi:hypothetical protein